MDDGPWSVPGTPMRPGGGGPPGGDPDGWAPDPSPRRSSPRWGLVAAVVVGLVVAAVGLSVAMGTSGSDPVATSTSDVASSEPGPAPTTPPSGDPSGTPPDAGDLDPAVATAHRDLFAAIDESERAMIALNASTPSTTTDLGADELAAFRDEAGERADELEAVRDRLEGIDDAGSDAVTSIRDAYLVHLGDWIDWADAVADDPTLLDRPDAASPYFDAINFSAEDFAAAVANDLDRDRVPSDVRDLADEIIGRGFSSSDDGTDI